MENADWTKQQQQNNPPPHPSTTHGELLFLLPTKLSFYTDDLLTYMYILHDSGLSAGGYMLQHSITLLL